MHYSLGAVDEECKESAKVVLQVEAVAQVRVVLVYHASDPGFYPQRSPTKSLLGLFCFYLF